MTRPTAAPCAWHGHLCDFVCVDESDWGAALCNHHERCALEPAGDSQKRAWHHCFLVLRDQLGRLLHLRPEAASWHVVFEYELPRERGRRPDVVILGNRTVVVLEFKDYASAYRAHVDQAAACARDLHHYHAASHDAAVIPVLVLTQSSAPVSSVDGVTVVGHRDLAAAVDDLVHVAARAPIDPDAWIRADYAPLPTLVAAARTIFEHEPLPQIRRAHSAGIPETIAELVRVADEAQASTSCTWRW